MLTATLLLLNLAVFWYVISGISSCKVSSFRSGCKKLVECEPYTFFIHLTVCRSIIAPLRVWAHTYTFIHGTGYSKLGVAARAHCKAMYMHTIRLTPVLNSCTLVLELYFPLTNTEYHSTGFSSGGRRLSAAR